MKTTQKRGIGRALGVDGDGAAAFPPSPLGPVTVYRQPEAEAPTGRSLVARVLGWLAIVLAMCIAGVAGGAYLYFHESVAAVAVESEDVKKAVQKLDIVLPGAAANALVIGYDRRADESEGTPSRSDTIMLVRADPDEKTISLLSFPRDMTVDVHCPSGAQYRGKINSAYAECGPEGTLQTVKALTGSPSTT